MNQAIMEKRMVLWYGVICEQQKSGIGVKSWCTSYNVPRSSFHRWQKDIREYILENGEDAFQKLVEMYSRSGPMPSVPRIEELKPRECESVAFVELLPAPPPKPVPRTRKEKQDAKPTTNKTWNSSSDCSPISIQYGDFKIDLNDHVDENQLLKVLKVIKDVN